METPGKRLQHGIGILTKEIPGKLERQSYDLEVRSALNDILQVAQQYGLSPVAITELVSIICKQKFTEEAKLKLARCLLPNTVVPSAVILKLISWIGAEKSSSDKLSVFLLGWIVAVFDKIDNLHDVRCLYAIIMQYLEHDRMHRYACMLLNLLTCKNHVLPYRVQRIHRINSKLGGNVYLNSLLTTYKSFRPDLVNIEVPSSKTLVLPRSMRKTWTDRLIAINERTYIALQKEVQILTFSEIYSNMLESTCDTTNMPATKTVRRLQHITTTIPLVGNDIGQSLRLNNRSISMNRFSFQDLMHSILTLEPAQRSSAILRCPDLQHIVSCLGNKEYVAQLICYINGFLCSENSDKPDVLEDLFEKVILFSDYLQEGIPILKTFLSDYLNCAWNGTDAINCIFKIIPRLHFCSVEDLKVILQPIQKFYILFDINCKVKALQSLTSLLRNYTSIEWQRFKAIKNNQQERPSQFVYLFDHDTDDVSPSETIEYLINFTDILGSIGLYLEKGNSLLLHTLLTFYFTIADASLVHGLKCDCVPSAGVVYYSLFTIDTAALSRICSLLVKCRKVLDANKLSKETEKIKYSNAIMLMNRFILDLSNSMWRRMPFPDQEIIPSIFDLKENGSSSSGETIASRVSLSGDTFSFAYHPALIGLAKKFRDHMGHDTLVISKRSTAYELMQFIATNGFPGIMEFLSTFIKQVQDSLNASAHMSFANADKSSLDQMGSNKKRKITSR